MKYTFVKSLAFIERYQYADLALCAARYTSLESPFLEQGWYVFLRPFPL